MKDMNVTVSLDQASLNRRASVFRAEYKQSLVGVLTVSSQGITWRAGASREEAKLTWFELKELMRKHSGIEEQEMGFAE